MENIKKIDLVDIELNGGSIQRSWLNHSIGTGDASANAFGIRAFRGGQPVNMEGGSVQGYFRNSQGQNIALTSYGTISGNEAYVTLPQACYNYEGQFTLAVKMISDNNDITGTMRIVDGVVDNTNSGGAVAPTGSVPTYQEVLSVYDQMVAAKAGSVRFDISQDLTATQRLNARNNIMCASQDDMDTVQGEIGTVPSGETLQGQIDTLESGKVPVTRKVNGRALSADVTVTKGDVGLGNCDNTSDANKPISTAQAAVNTEVSNKIGNTALPTTAQTLTGAIEEHDGDLTNQQGQITDLKSALNHEIVLSSLAPTLDKGKYYKKSDGKGAYSDKYCRTNLLTGITAASLSDSVTYIARLIYYDATGSTTGAGFLGASDTSSGIIRIPMNAVKVGINISRVDETNITDNDVTAIAAILKIYVSTDTTLTLANKAADAKTVGDKIGNMNNIFDLFISTVPKKELNLKSGRLNDNGSYSADNTRIRSASSSTKIPNPVAISGDFYNIAYPYEAKVAVYNENSLTSSNFVAWVNSDWTTGTIFIPASYVGKYTAITIRKIGYESSDISGDVATITNYITYHCPAISNDSNILKPMRILGIGNSYTLHVFRYLSKIIKECGYEDILTGQCYKGGITLKDAYDNRESTDYFDCYRTRKGTISYTDTTGVSLQEVLDMEEWDYIVFQQQSDDSGIYSSFFGDDFDFNDFIEYVKGYAPNAKIGLVSPWTHAHGYTGNKFIEYYGGSVEAQDAALKTVIPQVANEMDALDTVIDLTSLIDSARENTYLGAIGDEMTRDKNHVDYGIPEYVCSVLYAMCLGIDITHLTWYPTATEDASITTATNGYLGWLARQAAKSVYNQFYTQSNE